MDDPLSDLTSPKEKSPPPLPKARGPVDRQEDLECDQQAGPMTHDRGPPPPPSPLRTCFPLRVSPPPPPSDPMDPNPQRSSHPSRCVLGSHAPNKENEGERTQGCPSHRRQNTQYRANRSFPQKIFARWEIPDYPPPHPATCQRHPTRASQSLPPPPGAKTVTPPLVPSFFSLRELPGVRFPFSHRFIHEGCHLNGHLVVYRAPHSSPPACCLTNPVLLRVQIL